MRINIPGGLAQMIYFGGRTTRAVLRPKPARNMEGESERRIENEEHPQHLGYGAMGSGVSRDGDGAVRRSVSGCVRTQTRGRARRRDREVAARREAAGVVYDCAHRAD